MNKQELIEYCESLKGDLNKFINGINVDKIIAKIEQLDEPQAGHADETPRYVRNVIARLRELPLHDREVWLKAIMDEFDEDFSHAKWREGYEQGKFEGAWVGEQLKDADKIRRELSKPVVPQFVADWIEYCKFTHVDLQYALIVDDVYFYNYANQNDFSKLKEFLKTENNQENFARAWLDGYTVEEEAKYKVKFKGISGNINCLNHNSKIQKWYLASNYETDIVRTKFTRKELEEAGFGEVFNSPLFEVEEVEE